MAEAVGTARAAGAAETAQRAASKVNVVSMSEVLRYLEEDRWMDMSEAADYLRMCVKTFKKYLSEIPHSGIGGKTLFRKSTLDAWVEQHRVRDELLEEAIKAAEELVS